MVYLNGFALEILPEHGDVDKFTRDGAKYVGLDHGSEYRIKLINNTDRRADVKVELEGESIGRWRIEAHDDLVIERPADRARKFTFLSEMSMEAIDAGVIVGDNTNGLVVATFYPEKARVYEALTVTRSASPERLSAAPSGMMERATPSASLMTMRGPSYESGATVLGEHSQQEFGRVRALRDDEIDWDKVSKIQLRLVVRNRPKPIPRPVSLIRRTPYPERIDEPYPRYSRI